MLPGLFTAPSTYATRIAVGMTIRSSGQSSRSASGWPLAISFSTSTSESLMTSRSVPPRRRTICTNSLYALSVKPPAAAIACSTVTRELGDTS